jgi:hypothetical protein
VFSQRLSQKLSICGKRFGHKKCAQNEHDNGRAGRKILAKLVLERVGEEVHIAFKPPKICKLISYSESSGVFWRKK